MAFSVYEVVRVGCQSRNIKQTNYATDKRGETLRKLTVQHELQHPNFIFDVCRPSYPVFSNMVLMFYILWTLRLDF